MEKGSGQQHSMQTPWFNPWRAPWTCCTSRQEPRAKGARLCMRLCLCELPPHRGVNPSAGDNEALRQAVHYDRKNVMQFLRGLFSSFM